MCHNHTLVVKRTLKQATRESKMLSHVAYFTDLMLNNREKWSDFTGQTGGMALFAYWSGAEKTEKRR